MKWMLVVMLFGVAPVKTGLPFSSLDECLLAEDAMRSQYWQVYNKWLASSKVVPGDRTDQYFMARHGIKSPGTCIPHSATMQ